MHFLKKWWMKKWSEIFWQIFRWHFLHQDSWWEVFDGELLEKKMSENEEICRVEPTIQDVRELCLGMQIRCPKTGIESFGSISERKIKGKALKLAFLKTTHYMSHITQIHQRRKFSLLSKAPLVDSIRSKKILCKWPSQIQVILRNVATSISPGPIRDNCARR